MEKINTAELNETSAKFAGEYIKDHYKSSNAVTKSLVVNTIAHGFYMGARHLEKFANMTPLEQNLYRIKCLFTNDYLPLYPAMDERWIERQSVKAAQEYLTKKNYDGLSWEQKALIKACVSTGFISGVKYREQRSH